MDWDKFRAETAAAIVAAIMGKAYADTDARWAEVRCGQAIAYADELIKQLRS